MCKGSVPEVYETGAKWIYSRLVHIRLDFHLSHSHSDLVQVPKTTVDYLCGPEGRIRLAGIGKHSYLAFTFYSDFQAKFLQLICALYTDILNCVWIEGETSDWFTFHSGILQPTGQSNGSKYHWGTNGRNFEANSLF